MYRILICDDDEAILSKISSIAESSFSDQMVKIHVFTRADQIINQILEDRAFQSCTALEGAVAHKVYRSIHIHKHGGAGAGTNDQVFTKTIHQISHINQA